MHKTIMHYGFMELMLKTWKWNLNKTIILLLQCEDEESGRDEIKNSSETYINEQNHNFRW